MPPEEWLLGQICEGFGIPIVEGGSMDQPLATALDILELRGYLAAKNALEEAKSEADVQVTPMVQWVWRVQLHLHQSRFKTADMPTKSSFG